MCGKVQFACDPKAVGRFGCSHTKPGRICKIKRLPVGAVYVGGKFMIGERRFVQSVKNGMCIKDQNRSTLPPPCQVCYQVKNPAACENKDCKRWRSWFVTQWDSSRQRLLHAADVQPRRVQGIPLGGRYYYHPEHLMEYLDKDPCKICYLAGCGCQVPCQLRKNWVNAREEAGL